MRARRPPRRADRTMRPQRLWCVVAVCLLARSASGWISISQSRFGADAASIAAELRGDVVDYSPQVALGYLWSYPDDPLSDHGLGGGIAFALDPLLCHRLLPQFREDYLLVHNLLSCTDVQAALHRAFGTWSSHHKYIRFHECVRARATCTLVTPRVRPRGISRCPPHHTRMQCTRMHACRAAPTPQLDPALDACCSCGARSVSATCHELGYGNGEDASESMRGWCAARPRRIPRLPRRASPADARARPLACPLARAASAVHSSRCTSPCCPAT